MIKAARDKKKYTQAFLAKKTGISQGYISKLETSNIHSPTIREILLISKALDLCPLVLTNWFISKDAHTIKFSCQKCSMSNLCNFCSLQH